MENNNLQVQNSLAQLNTERISRLLTKNLSEGIVLVDLIGERLGPETMAGAVAILQVAYGKEYSEEKLNLLYGMCREDDWSAKRFMDTLRWIIRNKPFPDWKIADFFTAPLLKLHPRSWMVQQVGMGNKCKQYLVGEHLLYALASDDIPLPEYVLPSPAFIAPASPEATSEERERILAELKSHVPTAREKHILEPLGKITEDLDA